MIGYYVHHQGRGHLHRATALAAAVDEQVVGLSSLPRPEGWRDWDGWVLLDRDDLGRDPTDRDARGRLHWVPVGDDGLRRRTAQLSAWLDTARPRLVVVDVSVEVALLTRLHGIPVATVLQPGRRTDPAHRLGQDVSDHLVGFWPPSATDGLLPGVPEQVRRRVHAVGALARFPVRPPTARRPGPPRVLVLSGTGGPDLATGTVRHPPGWDWTELGTGAAWCDDPRVLIEESDVVVTHAGQNALAEVAAARRPALVVPQTRPHDEQHVTAALLAGGSWPVQVADRMPREGWSERLSSLADLDADRWAEWCDGRAAQRFAEVVAEGSRP
ncbi:glycosyltransferase [Nocardioides sp.]|uniref:glycosyltransferase n=1 Tax=Nocardioides sp. TaxID=35761 RepID=UPI003783BCE8